MVSPLKFNFDISLPNSTFTAETFRVQHELRATRSHGIGGTGIRFADGIGGTGIRTADGIGGTGIRIADGIGGTGISDGIGGTGIQGSAATARSVTGTPVSSALNRWTPLKSLAPSPLESLPQANTRVVTADDLKQRLNEIQLVQNAWHQSLFKLSFV